MGFSKKMFESGPIMRLHHLFVIQTLLELQRQCNIWYSRLKHKFVLLLNKRLCLNNLRSLASSNARQQQSSQRDFEAALYYHTNGRPFDSDRVVGVNDNSQLSGWCQPSIPCGQLMTNLNQMLNGTGAPAPASSVTLNGSVSIPMLLLPFIVQQPRVVDPAFKHVESPQMSTTTTTTTTMPADSYDAFKQGREIYRSSNNLRHLTNSGAQTSSFRLSGGGGCCWSGGGAAGQAQAQSPADSSTRNLALDCNLVKQYSNWSSARTNNLAALRSNTSNSLALRNPLICFPSTSNEIGHVKYM
jgi:hypothetical protein